MSWHPPAERRHQRRFRTLALLFLGVAVVVLVGLGATALYARSQLEAPSSDHSQTAVLVVRDGESLDTVVDDLAAHGLIRSTTWFSLWARFKGLGDVAPGRYQLDSGMGASAVISRLEASPDPTVARLLLPEGLTAQQMAQRVAAAGVGITADQYMNEVQHGTFDEAFLATRPAGASLEGFLFPDTYEVTPGMSAHDLVRKQLDEFGAQVAPLLSRPSSTALSPYQSLILASIVEREARLDVDRPKVAEVMVNRLAKGMKLQIDATVAYGVGKPGAEPSPSEMQQDTPYNTYVRAGLPVGPISNPGLSSIRAALAPESGPNLFYVSDGCGVNHYAATDDQFEQIKSQYVGTPCTSAPPSPSPSS